MPRGVLSFINAMTSIGVGEHRELFVMVYEFIDERFHSKVMAIVIACAMHKKKLAFQLMGKI